MPAPGMPTRANAVISLLDEPTASRVRALWSELDSTLGLRGIQVMPYPHFTYHVAEAYDRAPLDEALEARAGRTAPFTVRTTGVGTFAPPWPVVYLALAEDPALRELHRAISALCSPFARGETEFYGPARCTPHISLAYGDERTATPLRADEVDRVLRTLEGRDLHWTIPIDNLAFVEDDGSVHKPVRTFRLAGR